MHVEDEGKFYIPAQVRAVGDAERLASLSQILRNERVLDASVLDQHSPFFWRAFISNTRVDTHFTHMMVSSLRNYAREAAIGVAFLPGHNWRHQPIGGSLTGELLEENGETSVRADFYTLAGLEIGEVKTDGLIASIKGALTRDVSIGMYGGKWLCDICGQDYYRGRCPHLAGFTYEEEKDGVIRQVLALVGIEDAHLSEVSGVFDGSTPGAMIDKVYEMARAGTLNQEDVRHAQIVYRMDKEATQRMLALPALQKRHAGVEVPGQTPRKVERMNEQQFKRLTEILVTGGVVPADQREALDEDAALTAADKLTARLKELEPQAADGRQYRSDMVAEALAEGVRAQGKDFDQPTYEAMLTNAPIATIKRMRDDWQRIGNERLKGGRQSVDDDQTPGQEQTKSVSLVPDAAYRA